MRGFITIYNQTETIQKSVNYADKALCIFWEGKSRGGWTPL